jgi:Zn-dependent protease with chaperone function
MELEQLHVTILAVTAIAIAVADHYGLQYMRGVAPLLNARTTHILHYIVWVGLSGMIITGALLVAPALSYYAAEPAFIVKMCMVLALVVNGIAIGILSRHAYQTPFAQLAISTKRALFVSGAVSTSCWIGAALIGYFVL